MEGRKIKDEEISILDEFVEICNKHHLKYYFCGGTLLGCIRHKGMIPRDDDIDIVMPRKDFQFLIKNKHLLSDNFYLDFWTTNRKYCYFFAKIRKKNTLYLEKESVHMKLNHEFWIDIFPMDFGNKNKKKNQIKKKVIEKINLILCCKATYFKYNKHKFFKVFLSFIPNILLFHIRDFVARGDDFTEYVNYGSHYVIEKQTNSVDMYEPAINAEFENKLYKVPYKYHEILEKLFGPNYMEIPSKDKQINHNPLEIRLSNGEFEKHF